MFVTKLSCAYCLEFPLGFFLTDLWELATFPGIVVFVLLLFIVVAAVNDDD